MTLRTFLYLDEYKMYSVSSQLFEGMTEMITSRSSEVAEDREEQRGPVGSGRVLADIARRESQSEEQRSLHDFGYVLFEEELRNRGFVVDYNVDTAEPRAVDIESHPGFVRVSGPGLFLDIPALVKFMKQFNNFGQSLAITQTVGERQALRQELEQVEAGESDRNRKSQIRQRLKQLKDPKFVAEGTGLQFDQDFLENTSFLLEESYGDRFELQMQPWGDAGLRFTALLSRDCFREPERAIVQKYSRRAQTRFSVLGVITQVGEVRDSSDASDESGLPGGSIRDAVLNMILRLTDVETSFSGVQEREVIIDPIAVYRELQGVRDEG